MSSCIEDTYSLTTAMSVLCVTVSKDIQPTNANTAVRNIGSIFVQCLVMIQTNENIKEYSSLE